MSSNTYNEYISKYQKWMTEIFRDLSKASPHVNLRFLTLLDQDQVEFIEDREQLQKQGLSFGPNTTPISVYDLLMAHAAVIRSMFLVHKGEYSQADMSAKMILCGYQTPIIASF